mmetsp:Transcript_19556/g.54593  ORF Transcript_19556/g.54593 Transcript_19556/m.54593 type:complete len:382 (-) Transcript_19556:1375-2520(-)
MVKRPRTPHFITGIGDGNVHESSNHKTHNSNISRLRGNRNNNNNHNNHKNGRSKDDDKDNNILSSGHSNDHNRLYDPHIAFGLRHHREQQHQQQQQQQPQPPNKDQDKDGSRLPPVFSRDYWEHGIRSTTVEHGYYYNFTHEGLEFPVDEADPSRKLQPSLTHSVTQRYRHNDVIPTCFGGVFATQWGQISSDDAPITPHGWSVITNELSRADNIEEGHYMERWWADLLSWSTYASSRQQEWARQLEGANASPTPGPSSAGTSAATSDATTAATSTWEEATAAVARERAEKERTTEYTTANEELHLSSLNQKEQLEFLDHKLLHWTSPDSYTGLIVLDSSTFGNENRPLQFHDEGPPGDKPPPAENQNQGNSGKRRRRKKQ